MTRKQQDVIFVAAAAISLVTTEIWRRRYKKLLNAVLALEPLVKKLDPDFK